MPTPIPAPGDLLIAEDPTPPASYTLSVVPGPPQIRCQTYEQALDRAQAWARRQGGAIWLTRDGTTFRQIVE